MSCIINSTTQVRSPLRGSTRRPAEGILVGFARLANAATPSMPPHSTGTGRKIAPAYEVEFYDTRHEPKCLNCLRTGEVFDI